MTRNHSGGWKALLRRLGALGGLFSVGLGMSPTGVVAQGARYQSAATAPAAWQTFATQLQKRLQERLADDEGRLKQLQAQIGERGGAEGNPVALTVRGWIRSDGRLERVEFDGLDQNASVRLSALLIGTDVGIPPADILQPLHLRLKFRPSGPKQDQ